MRAVTGTRVAVVDGLRSEQIRGLFEGKAHRAAEDQMVWQGPW